MSRVGIEIELLAPQGASRRDLARAWAEPAHGRVATFLHPDSEPSLVPGSPVFHNLTLGFRAVGPQGLIAHVVDDLTLQEDLDRAAAPTPGWWRILTDDPRLLHLVRRHAPADAGPRAALEPVAALFGARVEALPEGVFRVRDPLGQPIAMAAGLPGERERPAEVVTPPLPAQPASLLPALQRLLRPAQDRGFTVPAEAAVHLHLDAAPFRDPRRFAALVETLAGVDLRARLGANPRCRRLGPWPPALMQVVRAPGFRDQTWAQALPRLRALPLTKFCDVNLRGVVHDIPGKPTLEFRCLPGSIEPEAIVEQFLAVSALLPSRQM